MITVRRAADRGHADHGWLDTRHTFAFGDYRDPAHTRFRSLRVMNEDRVAPGAGFGSHPHRDMEILTYVLSGALEHRDSLGNGQVLHAGEVQAMTAGAGVVHSEQNASSTEPVHFYQVWLLPRRRGLPPAYQQKRFPPEGRRNRFAAVAMPDAAGGSLRVNTDARVYLATLDPAAEVAHTIEPGRYAWLQVARGGVRVGGTALAGGDGLAATDERVIAAVGGADGAELMLFDLA